MDHFRETCALTSIEKRTSAHGALASIEGGSLPLATSILKFGGEESCSAGDLDQLV